MYPILYDKCEENLRNLDHFGVGVLVDAVSCIVTEELNGVFNLEMKYPTSGASFDKLGVEMIIKADAGHKLKDQLFIINRIDTSMTGFVVVYADHISYLTQNIVIKPAFGVENVNAREALDSLSNSAASDHDFRFLSDIDDETNSLSVDIQTHSNLRQGLGSILETWGGEYTFDNFDISLNQRRGDRANTIIEYGRNLMDFAQEENISETVTTIYPYAVYRRPGADEDDILTVEGLVIDAPNAENLTHRRTLAVDFSREFDRDETPTESRLRELANQYMIDNGFGIPQVSITLSFVDLSNMASISGAALESVNLGDTVPVRFDKLGIMIDDDNAAKVVRVRWNVLLEHYDELDIGTIRASFSGQFNRVSSGMGVSTQNRMIESGNGIIVSEEEPPIDSGMFWIQVVDAGSIGAMISNLYVKKGISWRRLELEIPEHLNIQLDGIRGQLSAFGNPVELRDELNEIHEQIRALQDALKKKESEEEINE